MQQAYPPLKLFYFFALYHCLPDEKCELNIRRLQLRKQYPEKTIDIGKRFVLTGEPAFQIVSAYYQALAQGGNPESFRDYMKKRHEKVFQKHTSSQSLPIPIDLTEGQLCNDPDLDFFTCLAISNGQVSSKNTA